MSYSDLYIIGNGFDLAHGMPTKYDDFRRWLFERGRIDVIQELQKAFPSMKGGRYLLWSDFETALGQYDIDTVIKWGWDDLYLTSTSIGNMKFDSPSSLLNIQLPDIIRDVFPEWVKSIPIATIPAYNLPSQALYLSFNYTDTIERLYRIPERQILHIHGRVSVNDALVVGHNRYIDPSKYWDDNLDVRENNERMQRLVDMNDMQKPIFELINQNEFFFRMLNTVQTVTVLGHSCATIDYPYFRKVKLSVRGDAEWNFNPFSDEDVIRINTLKEDIGLAI